MTAATAARHTVADLTFVRADDLLNIVRYTSVSASGANGATNHTALDVITGEILCSCKGAGCGKTCWHYDLIAAAWDAHPARAAVVYLTDDELVRAGHKAANMCRVYRRRTWRVLPADQVALLACRVEYRARAARRAAIEAAVTATVAA